MPTHVQIMPRMVPATEEVRAKRADIARSLETLGLIEDASAGRVNDEMRDGWIATVAGVSFTIAGYAVEPDNETGSPLLTVCIVADSLAIGERDTAKPTPAPAEKPKPVSVWGSPGRDPREGIPGWVPEGLGEQVAGNAARQVPA